MNTFITFFKKELMSQMRTKKIMILAIVFGFFGIFNPLTAKVTPILIDFLSESLDGSGINISLPEVTALDSWMQFFSNLLILIIAFMAIQSSTFSKEYRRGTLILVLTKGYERFKVVLSKLLVLSIMWTLFYWFCFLLTYLINIVWWDNSIASNLLFASIIWWVFGLFVISLFTFMTSSFRSSAISMVVTAGVIFVLYLMALLPKIDRFTPVALTSGNSLIYGMSNVNFYIPSLIITICLMILCGVGSIFMFNRKQV